eukprot:4460098-Pyramimonas_sp.AAC.1
MRSCGGGGVRGDVPSGVAYEKGCWGRARVPHRSEVGIPPSPFFRCRASKVTGESRAKRPRVTLVSRGAASCYACVTRLCHAERPRVTHVSRGAASCYACVTRSGLVFR